jgi:hypothetical protein
MIIQNQFLKLEHSNKNKNNNKKYKKKLKKNQNIKNHSYQEEVAPLEEEKV